MMGSGENKVLPSLLANIFKQYFQPKGNCNGNFGYKTFTSTCEPMAKLKLFSPEPK